MKTRKISKAVILLAIVLLTAFTACSENKTIQDDGLPFQVETSIVQETEDNMDLDLQVPSLSGFEAAEEINAYIQADLDDAISAVEDAAEIIANTEDPFLKTMKANLYCRFQFYQNEDEEIGSICLSLSNYTGGAHGYYWMRAYTFNTDTGLLYAFSGLIEEKGFSAEDVTNLILEKVKATPDTYFDSAEEIIRSYDHNFDYYINSDGNIVIYFPLYTIAPYSSGLSTFTITETDLVLNCL